MAVEPRRRLVAIMFTDMVGYSALTQNDEAEALALLDEHNILVRAALATFAGREIKTVGDAFFAEFDSALVAVRCAIRIQNDIHARNGARAGAPIRIRIGIHLGDVVYRDGDVFGDGVNIAARVQATASADEIRISEDVARQIANKIDLPLVDLGPVPLKNIAQTVRVFSVALAWSPAVSAAKGAVPEVGPQFGMEKPGNFRMPVLAIAVIGMAFAVLGGAYVQFKPAAGPSASTASGDVANGINSLSIVVLPFANLTGDAKQTYIADGLTVSVTSDLSRLKGAFIVAATTAAAYKDKAVDAQQIGQNLGVRFVLQGNVQRNANTLRINAQLADAASNAQLWSETFEGDQSDLFALQDQVTTRIGNSIGSEMLVNAARASEKSKSSPKVADLLLRARATMLAQRSPTYFSDLETRFREVLQFEPDNALALASLAAGLALRAQYFRHTLAPEEREPYFAEALELALKAKQIDPEEASAYTALAMYAEAHDDYAGALRYAWKGYELMPRDQRFANLVAHALLMGGDAKQAMSILNRTLALNPKFPIDQIPFNLGWGSFMTGNYDDCISWFQRTIEANSTYIDAYGWMAMAYAMKGDMAKSREQLAKLEAADPNRSFMTRRQPMPSSPQAYKDFHENVVLPAARKAGIVG